MKKLPTIELERLILRPFELSDAKMVQQLAGDKDIAKTTQNIPHPYKDGMAEGWIENHEEEYDKDQTLTLAITDKGEGHLVGAIGISLNNKNENGELGYWIGKKYWNKGYCTEAAKGMMKFAFEEIKLNCLHARHLKRNPASGKVMKKLRMIYEGTLRHRVKKWGEFEDTVHYSILKDEYLGMCS